MLIRRLVAGIAVLVLPLELSTCKLADLLSPPGSAAALSRSASSLSAAPSSILPGSGSSTITVTARDSSGNPVPGASVLLAATGSGNNLTQPAGLTDAKGVTIGTLSSTVAESKTVSATINGTLITSTATVRVGSGPATQLEVSGLPNPFTALTTSTVTLTLRDDSGNAATGYSGTIHFTSTDPLASLPADYTFGPGDAGTHTFSPGVTLRTLGTQTVTATDATNSLSQSQTVTVTP